MLFVVAKATYKVINSLLYIHNVLRGHCVELLTEQIQVKNKYFSPFLLGRREGKARLFLNWNQFICLTSSAIFQIIVLKKCRSQ